jgi:hypothetical protein
MDAEVRVRDIERVETRSGKTRWVLIDDAGNVARPGSSIRNG